MSFFLHKGMALCNRAVDYVYTFYGVSTPTSTILHFPLRTLTGALLKDTAVLTSPRGGGLPYENDGDARRKIRIKPLKETNVGVVQALSDP